MLKLGSLFDGIGGFPYAAKKAGILPIWASEIEKAPISITKRHFPEMAHLGSITELDGANIEPADIITFGSPCQDLSITGSRAGLSGERSGLFMHAIRLIKEMRNATRNNYPTRIVWENVPGAFSTNKGEDFEKVVEAVAGIAEGGISVARPSGGWQSAGAVLGNGWSLAWRVLDAQFWGVPHRRRRIFLVADFGGGAAAEILFEQESRAWDAGQSEAEVQRGARIFERRADEYTADLGHSADRIQVNPRIAVTLKSQGGGGGAKTGLYCLPVPYICRGFGDYAQGDIGKTLLARYDVTTMDLIATKYGVRVLTPMECERAQGFPDGWTEYGHNGKRISDTQRYRALGNSVAIPCVQFIMTSMAKYNRR